MLVSAIRKKELFMETIDCIESVVSNMSDEEKGMLKVILEYGKKAEKEAGCILNSPQELQSYGKSVTPKWVAYQIDSAFQQGMGIVDVVSGKYGYGKILDVTIKEVLVKALHVSKPIFSTDSKTYEGAIQREGWIAENLLNSMITNMGEDERKAFTKQVEQLLKEKGISAGKAAQAGAAIIQGGLTAARAVMGFNFHILVAQVANLVVKAIAGRGLSFAANAAMQHWVKILFGATFGWIFTAVLTLPLLTSLINPREYDKLIPAIFIIGVSHLSKE